MGTSLKLAPSESKCQSSGNPAIVYPQNHSICRRIIINNNLNVQLEKTVKFNLKLLKLGKSTSGGKVRVRITFVLMM